MLIMCWLLFSNGCVDARVDLDCDMIDLNLIEADLQMKYAQNNAKIMNCMNQIIITCPPMFGFAMNASGIACLVVLNISRLTITASNLPARVSMKLFLLHICLKDAACKN